MWKDDDDDVSEKEKGDECEDNGTPRDPEAAVAAARSLVADFDAATQAAGRETHSKFQML